MSLLIVHLSVLVDVGSAANVICLSKSK